MSISLLAVCPLGSAVEDALTPREQEMLEMIQALEARVAELEARLDRKEPPAAPAEAIATPVEGTQEIPAEAPQGDELNHGSFRDGLRLESADGDFSMSIGGRLHIDTAFFHQDRGLRAAFGDEDDGVEFRRAEIELEGVLYGDWHYRTEFDFGGDSGEVKFKDMFVTHRNLPYVGTLSIGNIKEPLGMEQLTSSNSIEFMERSMAYALMPGYNLGLVASNTFAGERMTWTLGAFKETDDVPSDDDSDEDQGYAITGRLTGLPWYADEGRRLLHVGTAWSLRNPDGAVPGYRSRPPAHLAHAYLDTNRYAGYGLVDARADDVRLAAFELAANLGPVSVQGEYVQSEVDTTFGGDRNFDGWYVEASWLLTGEHRPYNRARGIFGNPTPHRNFAIDGPGWGAWQLALRYSTLDLSDGPVRGGEASEWTLGLNWYLNPTVRIMFNYVLADIEHDLYSGDLEGFQTRVQLAF